MNEEEFVSLGKEVIEIEGVDLLFAAFVGGGDQGDFFLQIDEVAVAAGQQGAEASLRYCRRG
jgi:hypothetical protein